MPTTGQGAVAVAGVGVIGQSVHERPVPIASVTKVMTALVVLQDHPLAAGAGGPTFTMTAADHQAWLAASAGDESNVEIVAGEKIDERQLLEALLVPSADNVADYLARWDAGSIKAFVAKMNAEAARLGLTETHYADASGLNPGSRSTARDQVVLGGYAMRSAVIRQIVSQPYVDLPTAGRVWNYNPMIGVDGVVGLKSGFTQQAEGCLVTAAWRSVGGRRVLVMSAAFGQPLGLYQAGTTDRALLDAVTPELVSRLVVPKEAVVGRAVAPWAHRSVTVVLDPRSGRLTAVGWPGLLLSSSLRPVLKAASRAGRGWPAGDPVATLRLSAPGGVVAVSPAVLSGSLPPPPAGWTPSIH